MNRPAVDMSPEAVARRLEELGQLYRLARSLADGKGLTIRGDAQGLRAALWVYAISPAWLITSSLVKAYGLTKALGAVLSCLVVVPTWFLARRWPEDHHALRPRLGLAGPVAGGPGVAHRAPRLPGRLPHPNRRPPAGAGR